MEITVPTTTESIRKQLRAEVRHKRQQLSVAQQENASNKLLQQLISIPAVVHAKSVAVYLANDAEISLTPFIHWCWQQKNSVYLPVLHPFSAGHLLFLHYQPTTTMVQNKYGILEPKLNVLSVKHPHQLNVLLTPLVAFDQQGARLGMGGGFYDRTLSTWFNNKPLQQKLTVIGIAHDCQQVDSIPSAIWDIPLPTIATPSQIFTF